MTIDESKRHNPQDPSPEDLLNVSGAPEEGEGEVVEFIPPQRLRLLQEIRLDPSQDQIIEALIPESSLYIYRLSFRILSRHILQP